MTPNASQRIPLRILGYVVARGVLGSSRAAFLASAGASEDGCCVESTWSHASDDALVLPSRPAAVMLACAVGAGDAEIAAVAEEGRMTKRQIRQMAAKMADDLARACGDVAAAREAWIDVGASNAGWRRRGPANAKRVGARAGR